METEQLNNYWDEKEIKDFLEFNENECTAYLNSWDTKEGASEEKSQH